MSQTGDGRAAWITDGQTDTTQQPNKPLAEGNSLQTVTGDPRAAHVRPSDVEIGEAFPGVPQKTTTEQTETGDPRRAAFAAGYDTTAPARQHAQPDTGIHSVGTGDPRAAWVSNAAVDEIDVQEEQDIRRAIAASLKDQGVEDTNEVASGDPRASWLHGDTAHGGPHNWSKRELRGPAGEIRDPRAP